MFPKIGGKPPKWMVYNGSKPYFLMDDLGVPLFLETPICGYSHPSCNHQKNQVQLSNDSGWNLYLTDCEIGWPGQEVPYTAK